MTTKDTGNEPAQTVEPVEPTEPTEPTEPAEPAEPTGPQSPFTPEQEQYMGSWFGRIVSNQLEEKVMPHLNKVSETQPTNIPNAGSEDALTKFNEKVQTMIFDGKVLEAFQLVQDVQNRAKTNVSQAQKVETDKLITNLSDQPYYKDIFSDVKNIASEMAELQLHQIKLLKLSLSKLPEEARESVEDMDPPNMPE